jgi:farnesyl-diphosphate farnesyltransferase
VWSKYVPQLSDFAKPSQRRVAVQCLNELVTDALALIPDVFLYMSRLTNKTVFNFCSIPQVISPSHRLVCPPPPPTHTHQYTFAGRRSRQR